MKLNCGGDRVGHTLGEMLVAIAISSFMLAAAYIAFVSLQKSLNAVDNYFSAQMQQVRIIDYLSRDAKRAYIVQNSLNPETVTCTIPNYLVRCGDPDANATCTSGVAPSGSNIGTRRTPKITPIVNPTLNTVNANGIIVNYAARTVNDAVTAQNSPTLTSASANFSSTDVGTLIMAAGVPFGTTIQSVSNSTTVTMSANATATSALVTAVIGPATSILYSINNESIQRQENGVLTTTAWTTDHLLPNTTDVTLANTEYLTTKITFLPVFKTNSAGGNSTADNMERTGTTLYSTAYLRNKRRG